MKKACAILLSLSVFLSACAGPAKETEPAGSAGTAANSDNTHISQEAEQTESQNGDTAANNDDRDSGTDNRDSSADKKKKPDLVLMRQEKQDYSRAARNRKNTVADDNISTLQANTDAPKVSQKNYTIMVYIIGSDLESKGGYATDDIKEMMGAGLDYSRNNLLVYTGGSKRWGDGIPSECNNVIDLGKNKDQQVTAKTSEAANMGIPRTLSEFINYCTTYYPARDRKSVV